MFFHANPRDQERHVSRRFYLARLSEYARQGKNAAIIGPVRSGKTILARELIESIRSEGLLPVYIGLNRTSTPPENFSIELVGGLCFWSLGFHNNPSFSPLDWQKFLDAKYLLTLQEKIGKDASSVVEFLANELQKIKPDQKAMLEKSFSFPGLISKHVGKRIVLILDDFENIFDLNNFSQIKDVLSLMELKSKNVSYFAFSSSAALLRKSIKGFEFLDIPGLTHDESDALSQKFAGKAEKKILDEIYSLSGSNPILVKSIAKRFSETKDIKKAFLVELTLRNSESFHYLESSLSDFLNRARGESMPKTIVKAMSFMKDARLSEIAVKVYRSAPVTKSILERMLLVDMIVKTDNKYSFANPVLKKWLKLQYSGFEFDEIPSDDLLKKAQEVLDEQQ